MMKDKKWLWAKRIIRNRSYHLLAKGKIPWHVVARDYIITAFAWGCLVYLCWDFIVTLEHALVYQFDDNPANNPNWGDFLRKLKISSTFSISVVLFLFSWFGFNLYFLSRTKSLEGQQTPYLPLGTQVAAYGCRVEDVEIWRRSKVLTIDVDSTGQIRSVESNEVSHNPGDVGSA